MTLTASPMPQPTESGVELTHLQSPPSGFPSNTDANVESIPNTLAPAYANFWRHLTAACPEMPNLTISCKKLTVLHSATMESQDEKQGEQTMPTLANTLINKVLGLDPRRLLNTKKQEVHSVSSASMILNPGEITLILSPPGHGKTTMLRAMAGRLHDREGKSSLTQSGKVADHSQLRWNGMTAQEIATAGINIAKLTAFVEQTDTHYPLLSVRETFRFALDAALADVSLLQKPEIMDAREKLVDAVIQTLGQTLSRQSL